MKCRAGWSTSWNQHCREKYQSPQTCRWHHPYGRKQRTKEPLDESERREWKSWLKTHYSKTKIMASGPPTSWQIDGETMETVTDFIFLGSKITVNDDCSHEIKRLFLLGRKAMTNWKVLLIHERCRDSWHPEEKNSIWGQWRGLIAQSFCIIKFY